MSDLIRIDDELPAERSPIGGRRGIQRSATLAHQLRNELESDILEGRLKPGTRLDEAGLSRRFQVSRTPVREALKELASSGLIKNRPRKGAIVSTLTVSEIIELYEVMAEIEAFAARLAARRMTDKDRESILEAHLVCRAAAEERDAEKFFRLNQAFHRTVHVASHNSTLANEATALNLRLLPYRRFITFRPGRIAESIGEHDGVLDALLRRDEEEACRRMRDHLQILADDTLLLASVQQQA